jgi:parvulin-like peptidyl-prolyl isomerase
MKSNKIILLLVCLVCLELSVFSLGVLAEDKIVAIVNSDVITQKDLNDFLNFMKMRMSDKNSTTEAKNDLESMKADLLDRLIEDRLILQEAKKNNIIVDESRIQAKIEEIKQRYPTEAEFQNGLKSQGLVQADIESKIRDQILMYNVIDQEIRAKIVVRPDEVTSFYEKNKKEFLSPEERDLEVVIANNNDILNSIISDLKSGKDLLELETKYSVKVDKIKVTQEEGLKKEIADAVFKLKISEVSAPVNVEAQYYVFKLDNIISPKLLSLSEVQDKIHNYIFEMKMQEKLTKWLDDLKKNSYIKIVQS